MAVVLAFAVLLLSITSCVCIGERVELVDLRTEEQTIDLGGAERVVVEVEIGIGKLRVKGGSLFRSCARCLAPLPTGSFTLAVGAFAGR